MGELVGGGMVRIWDRGGEEGEGEGEGVREGEERREGRKGVSGEGGRDMCECGCVEESR